MVRWRWYLDAKYLKCPRDHHEAEGGKRLLRTNINEDAVIENALDDQISVQSGQRIARHLSLWLNMYICVLMCMAVEFSTWSNSMHSPQDGGKGIRNPGQLFALTTSIFICFFVILDILGHRAKGSVGKGSG